MSDNMSSGFQNLDGVLPDLFPRNWDESGELCALHAYLREHVASVHSTWLTVTPSEDYSPHLCHITW